MGGEKCIHEWKGSHVTDLLIRNGTIKEDIQRWKIQAHKQAPGRAYKAVLSVFI
jgi:hypothetical protein